MRVALAAGVLGAFALLPYLLRTSLLARGSPMVLAWFGVTSLFGIAAGFFALLAAMVSPGPLPLVDLPRAVEVCIAATGRLLSHPLKHWTSILAAVLLLAAAVRVVASAVLMTRDLKRARPPRGRLPGEEDALRKHFGMVPSSVRLLPHDGPIAFTTGLLGPSHGPALGCTGHRSGFRSRPRCPGVGGAHGDGPGSPGRRGGDEGRGRSAHRRSGAGHSLPH